MWLIIVVYIFSLYKYRFITYQMLSKISHIIKWNSFESSFVNSYKSYKDVLIKNISIPINLRPIINFTKNENQICAPKYNAPIIATQKHTNKYNEPIINTQKYFPKHNTSYANTQICKTQQNITINSTNCPKTRSLIYDTSKYCKYTVDKDNTFINSQTKLLKKCNVSLTTLGTKHFLDNKTKIQLVFEELLNILNTHMPNLFKNQEQCKINAFDLLFLLSFKCINNNSYKELENYVYTNFRNNITSKTINVIANKINHLTLQELNSNLLSCFYKHFPKNKHIIDTNDKFDNIAKFVNNPNISEYNNDDNYYYVDNVIFSDINIKNFCVEINLNTNVKNSNDDEYVLNIDGSESSGNILLKKYDFKATSTDTNTRLHFITLTDSYNKLLVNQYLFRHGGELTNFKTCIPAIKKMKKNVHCVADRLYGTAFELHKTLVDNGIGFTFRIKEKTNFVKMLNALETNDIICKSEKYTFRIVKYFVKKSIITDITSSHNVYYLITTNLTSSIEKLAIRYKKRWSVETEIFIIKHFTNGNIYKSTTVKGVIIEMEIKRFVILFTKIIAQLTNSIFCNEKDGFSNNIKSIMNISINNILKDMISTKPKIEIFYQHLTRVKKELVYNIKNRSFLHTPTKTDIVNGNKNVIKYSTKKRVADLYNTNIYKQFDNNLINKSATYLYDELCSQVVCNIEHNNNQDINISKTPNKLKDNNKQNNQNLNKKPNKTHKFNKKYHFYELDDNICLKFD